MTFLEKTSFVEPHVRKRWCLNVPHPFDLNAQCLVYGFKRACSKIYRAAYLDIILVQNDAQGACLEFLKCCLGKQYRFGDFGHS